MYIIYKLDLRETRKQMNGQTDKQSIRIKGLASLDLIKERRKNNQRLGLLNSISLR